MAYDAAAQNGTPNRRELLLIRINLPPESLVGGGVVEKDIAVLVFRRGLTPRFVDEALHFEYDELLYKPNVRGAR